MSESLNEPRIIPPPEAREPSVFDPETVQQVQIRLDMIDGSHCPCGETLHLNMLHDLATTDVPWLLEQHRVLGERVEAARKRHSGTHYCPDPWGVRGLYTEGAPCPTARDLGVGA